MARRNTIQEGLTRALAPQHGVNPQTQETYTAIPAPGGTYHVYPGGRKVFVAAGQPVSPQTPPDTTGITPGDYQDAAYFEGAAGQQQQRDAALAQSETQHAQNVAARQAALDALAGQQPKDEQQVKQGANKEGLFYSGILGQRMGDLAAEYASKRAAADTGFTNAENDRIAGNLQTSANYTTGMAGLAADAVSRRLNADSSLADSGQLSPVPTPNTRTPLTNGAGVPATTQTAGPRPKVVVKNKSVYRYYGGGRKVYVRPASR